MGIGGRRGRGTFSAELFRGCLDVKREGREGLDTIAVWKKGGGRGFTGLKSDVWHD